MLDIHCQNCGAPLHLTALDLLPSHARPAGAQCLHCFAETCFGDLWTCITMFVGVALGVAAAVFAPVDSVFLGILVFAAVYFPLVLAVNVLYVRMGGRLVVRRR